jgi:hypothetical protein
MGLQIITCVNIVKVYNFHTELLDFLFFPIVQYSR